MTSNDEYVLQLLRERGYVTAEQLDVASQAMREGNETTLDVLVASGALTEDDVLGTIAEQFGMKYVNIDPSALDPEIGKEIDPEIARKYGVAPVMKDADSVTVVLSDPMNYDAVDSLRYVLHGKDVEAVLAPAADVKALMDKLYPTGADEITARTDDGFGDDEGKMDSPPKRLQGAILSRFKIMSKIKISEKRIPQDGRIQVNVGGRDLDLRVSTVPTNHGESIVMRILDKSNLALGLPQLGFLSDDQSKFERFIHLSDGVVLVTGPTGSGKSTTLYAALGQINLPDRKIITVEDPVEYQMSGINQVQVNRDVGLDFSAALRSILRQAPNIVMIGEIRDSETADIAMEASLTGHLVFSTLHTNDAPSAVTRLTDMGVVQGGVHDHGPRQEDARPARQARPGQDVRRQGLRGLQRRLQGPQGHLRDLRGGRHDPAPDLRPCPHGGSPRTRPRNGHAHAARGRYAQGRLRHDLPQGGPPGHDGRRRLGIFVRSHETSPEDGQITIFRRSFRYVGGVDLSA